jgi:integrase
MTTETETKTTAPSGKKRIYGKVAGQSSIYRLSVWDDKRRRYVTPERGNVFEAYRYEIVNGHRKRVKETFASINEARNWQAQRLQDSAISIAGAKPQKPAPHASEQTTDSGPLFRDVIEMWRSGSNHQVTTRLSYDSKIRLYLGCFLDMPVRDITPQTIDLWLTALKERDASATTTRRHYSFRHELEVLSSILRYYDEYGNDREFRFPVKPERHGSMVFTDRAPKPKLKNMREAEFFSFRAELLKRPDGRLLAALATIQFYQALRISEAAAIYWEDVQLDRATPRGSRLNVRRLVVYTKKKGVPSFITWGYKNCRRTKRRVLVVKEQPLLPESFKALAGLWHQDAKGLVFELDGTHLAYRKVQYEYDCAFEAAGLPYSATHIMRHGGSRNIVRKGGRKAAEQMLGNSSAVDVYTELEKPSLQEVAETLWTAYEQKTS